MIKKHRVFLFIVIALSLGVVFKVSYSDPQLTKAQYEYLKMLRGLGIEYMELNDGRKIPTNLVMKQYETDEEEMPVEPRHKSGEKITTIADLPEEKRSQVIKQRHERGVGYIKSLEREINVKGRVVDQDNRPVEGVTVNARLQYIGAKTLITLKPAYENMTLITDHNGEFKIESEKATGYYIDGFIKQNYEINTVFDVVYSPERVFVFNAYHLPEEKPVKLIKKEKHYIINPDGREHSINLESGKVVQGIEYPDLIVQFKRKEDAERHEKIDWLVRLISPDGGLIETNDTFMYEAPEAGYQKEWVLKYDKNSDGWKAEDNRKLFIKARNGRLYAALNIDFVPVYGYKKTALLRIKSVVNTNSSRNLYSK